jgi:death-on-curing protein
VPHRDTGSRCDATEEVPRGPGKGEPAVWSSAEEVGGVAVDPLFLTLDEVIAIHHDQIKRYGGTLGIHDMTLLESAIAAPQAGFGENYLHRDGFEMAAAYLYHLVQNRPFIDGNKRVGAATALTFLELNGIETKIANQVLVDMVLSIAQGKMEKTAIAEFLKRHVGS